MSCHTCCTTQTQSCALQCCLLALASSCTSVLQPQWISSLASALASGTRVHIGFKSCGPTHPQSSAEGIYMVFSNILPHSSVHLDTQLSWYAVQRAALVGGIASMCQPFLVNSTWHASSMFTTFEVQSYSSIINHSSEATWSLFTSIGPVDRTTKVAVTSSNSFHVSHGSAVKWWSCVTPSVGKKNWQILGFVRSKRPDNFMDR